MDQDYSGFNLYELDFGIMKRKAEQDKIKNQQIEELQRQIDELSVNMSHVENLRPEFQKEDQLTDLKEQIAKYQD